MMLHVLNGNVLCLKHWGQHERFTDGSMFLLLQSHSLLWHITSPS